MLQVGTQFSQNGTSFNAGADGIFNMGNGLRGCTDQIANSGDDLRLTVTGTTVKVYDINGTDVSSTYVTTDAQNNPKIKIPVVTSADNASGIVHGTLTFPDNNDALVSITLQGSCGSNGCAGNFTTVHAGGAKTVDYTVHVPEVDGNNNPAAYFITIQSDQYGPVYADGSQSQLQFQTGTHTLTDNVIMAHSGIVQGTLYYPDGSIFLPKDGLNFLQANVQLQGNNSWGQAQVDRNGNFRAISLLPGVYSIDVQVNGNTTATMTGKKPAESVVVTAGNTVTHDAHLVNADYILPVWDISGLPTLFNQNVAGHGIRGELYSVLVAPTGSQIDGDFIRNILTNHTQSTEFDYVPVANNNNNCGPSYVGWCGAFEPDGQANDYFAVRKADVSEITDNGVTRDLYAYVLFLQKDENVAVDPSKESTPTINPSGSPIKPIRVAFAPTYTGEFISVSGTVQALDMFRPIDFKKMGGDFNKFVEYIPMITVQNEQGQTVAAGIVTPSAKHIGDSASQADNDAVNNAITSGDFNQFTQVVGGWTWGFEIDGLPKGHKYFLALTSPNYVSLTKTIDGTADTVWNVNWDTDGSTGGTIAGTISDAGGALANAFVEARTRGTDKTVTANSDGTYIFQGLPAGSYKVTASAGSHAPRAKRVAVTGTAVSTVDMTLPASDASISGTVSKFAAVSGAFLKVPADQVNVTAYDDTFNVNNPTEPLAIIQTQTASDGTYTLAGAQSGDTYKVSFQLDGYSVQTLAVPAVAGNNAGNDVVLPKKGLEVKVKISHDTNLAQYIVSILNPSNFSSGQIFLGPVETPFVQGDATDITGSFQQQPDGSLIGTIADAQVGSTNKNLHFIAVPANGDPNVIADYVFGPSVTDQVQQPIGDILAAGDNDNGVSGADNRTSFTVEPGLILANGDTPPSISLTNLTLDSLNVTVGDGGRSVGQAVQFTIANANVNPDRSTCASFPIDPNLIEDGFDPTKLQLYVVNAENVLVPLTTSGTYDPTTNTFQGCFSLAQTANEAPLNLSAAKGSVAVARAAAVHQPLTVAALKTAKSYQKNVKAASAAAAIFSVGLQPSTSTVTAIGYHQYNFPNPFNLKDKTVTLRSGTSGIPTTIHGSYIVVAPTGTGSPTIRIRIYNVAGDVVRELSGVGTAGKYNYFHWDGKNTSGDDVASGVYFAMVDAPGAPKKKPIKMVVVK